MLARLRIIIYNLNLGSKKNVPSFDGTLDSSKLSRSSESDLVISIGYACNAAMFDALYFYYTRVTENNQDKNKLLINIFQNPASEFSIMEFELPQTENVYIDILNPIGQSLENMNFPSCSPWN